MRSVNLFRSKRDPTADKVQHYESVDMTDTTQVTMYVIQLVSMLGTRMLPGDVARGPCQVTLLGSLPVKKKKQFERKRELSRQNSRRKWPFYFELARPDDDDDDYHCHAELSAPTRALKSPKMNRLSQRTIKDYECQVFVESLLSSH